MPKDRMSPIETATAIEEAIKRYVLPVLGDLTHREVIERLIPEVESIVEREARRIARDEAERTVRDMIGKQFLIEIHEVEGD